jgi:hypothetical protein
MNPKTPRTLVQFSAILVVLGIAVMDPLAGLALMVLAGILSIISITFGTKKVRVIAIILLAIVISFAIWKLPEARQHLQRYRDRAPTIEKEATLSNIAKGGFYNVTYMETDEGKGSRG